MSSEEKLNHLKDWMYSWIDYRLSGIKSYNTFWYFYSEFGLLISSEKLTDDAPITFEKYLQLIENK